MDKIFNVGYAASWYTSHKGIAIFHEALRRSFPNHRINCKLLCTTENCTETQFAHTDNCKWSCRFLDPNAQHVCRHPIPVCSRVGVVTRDMCPFSVFLAIEDHTSLVVCDNFFYHSKDDNGVVNPTRRSIRTNDAMMLNGSTGHAGTYFPPERRRKQRESKSIKCHFRGFFEGDPINSVYWSDPQTPQLKLLGAGDLE